MMELSIIKKMFQYERITTVTFSIEENDQVRIRTFYNVKTIIKDDQMIISDFQWEEKLTHAILEEVYPNFVKIVFNTDEKRITVEIHITES